MGECREIIGVIKRAGTSPRCFLRELHTIYLRKGDCNFVGMGKSTVYTVIAGCWHLLCSVMSLYLITAAPGGQLRRMNYISYPTMTLWGKWTLQPSHKHATAVRKDGYCNTLFNPLLLNSFLWVEQQCVCMFFFFICDSVFFKIFAPFSNFLFCFYF